MTAGPLRLFGVKRETGNITDGTSIFSDKHGTADRLRKGAHLRESSGDDCGTAITPTDSREGPIRFPFLPGIFLSRVDSVQTLLLDKRLRRIPRVLGFLKRRLDNKGNRERLKS
jgi:hypothetical protein